jgi:fatty-acyl-CoA synthase
MPNWTEQPLRTLDEVVRFEAALPIAQRLPGQSVYDVFVSAAEHYGKRTALTMVMNGAPDEQPRRVSYTDCFAWFASGQSLRCLGGDRPGSLHAPSLIETHATLWVQKLGYAIPINFLLQPAHIAELVKSSGAKILVALGPHPNSTFGKRRSSAPTTARADAGVWRFPVPQRKMASLDFHAEPLAQPDDRLLSGEPGCDDAVAAYSIPAGQLAHPS